MPEPRPSYFTIPPKPNLAFVIRSPLVDGAAVFASEDGGVGADGVFRCQYACYKEGDKLIEMMGVSLTGPFLVRNMRDDEKP